MKSKNNIELISCIERHKDSLQLKSVELQLNAKPFLH